MAKNKTSMIAIFSFTKNQHWQGREIACGRMKQRNCERNTQDCCSVDTFNLREPAGAVNHKRA